MQFFFKCFAHSLALVLLPLLVQAQETREPLRVVATLSTFADLVRTIGGERVTVKSIAAAQFNPHFIEPRPSDVLAVKRAELLVHGGLDLEAWRGPLLDAAGNPLVRPGGERELDLSRGIALLEIPSETMSRAQGDIHLFGNPHYWTDPRNGLLMARAIRTKLAELDPANDAAFGARLAAFEASLTSVMAQILADGRAAAGREVVGYHNEWGYLMSFLKLKMERFLEPKPGIPPSGQHIEELVHYCAQNRVGAVVQSSYFPKEAAEALAQRAGIPVVILCQNVAELPECSTYLDYVRFNGRQLVGAFQR